MAGIHVCAGIEYMNAEGQPVHSDICQEYRTTGSRITAENRAIMHAFLDEYLNLPPEQQRDGAFILGYLASI